MPLTTAGRSNVRIVRAQPQDSVILKEICITSKGYWGYPDHLMSQFAQTPIITPESIVRDIVYKACVDAATVGWYRLLRQAPVAILDDLWVSPAFMGKGIGRALFQHMVSQAQSLGALVIELDSDPNASPFYERMGCSTMGQSLTEWGRTVPRMRYSLPAHDESKARDRANRNSA
jgi:GNAT superfamily N-acetyltransferase